MKKFEEEIFGKVETMITQPGCSMTRKVWYSAGDIHDFSEDWISPEDYQTEIEKLKSQLEKRQPEIPEFVAKAVEEFKKQPDSYKGFSKVNEVWSWLNEYQMNNDDFGICGLNNKFFVLAHFAINGYTVKEKRFYLKHIDFCKRHKDYDWYMIKHSDGPLNHLRVEKGTLPPTVDTYFTQQEIDSMETGSYEQVEVEG